MKKTVLTILGLCAIYSNGVHAEPGPLAAGRWTSTDHVTTTSPAKSGAAFFLDVVLATDGTFRGTWELYVCFSYPGAYGIKTISCQRSREAAAASGRFDAGAGTGHIELERLGGTSFRFKLTSGKLDLELPRQWLNQGAPVLYETSLKLTAR